MIWNWDKIKEEDLEKVKEEYYDALIAFIEELHNCVERCLKWCVDDEFEISKLQCLHICESECRKMLGVEEDEDL